MINFYIWFICSFISTFGFTYLFCKLASLKVKITFKISAIFLLGVLFLSLIKYYDLSNISLISYFTFFPFLFYIISSFRLKDLIIYSLVIWAVGVIFDLISIILISFICHLCNTNLSNFYNIFSLISSIIVCIIFISLGNFKLSRNILKKIIKFISEIDYSNLPLILFSAFVFLMGLIISLNYNNIKSGMFLFIILILSLIVFILLIRFRINAIENKKYLETLRENNDFYIKMDDENRIFKHNLMAKLSSIKSVSNKKAIALIDDFVIKTNKTISYSKKIKRIPYGLNGIIYQRTYPYLEDINFNITNKIDFDIFKVLKPRRYNVLVEKLFVSLDNAIEASLNSKNKVVVINLYDDEENIYIEIKNSFSQKIDIDNLGSLNYSTKGKKRGLGLFSILRDNEASVNIKIVNNYFISIISARKQK